jgi:hypothetical protein
MLEKENKALLLTGRKLVMFKIGQAYFKKESFRLATLKMEEKNVSFA